MNTTLLAFQREFEVTCRQVCLNSRNGWCLDYFNLTNRLKYIFRTLRDQDVCKSIKLDVENGFETFDLPFLSKGSVWITVYDDTDAWME